VEALRGLPLTPVDGFILSRIDGRANEVDIANQTGLDLDTVRASIEKLVQLGVAAFPDGATSGVIPTPAAAAGPPPTPPPRPPSAPPQGDGIDLDREHRTAIEATFARLDEIDHYALLGVPRDADRKVIKRAYYDFASRYHPDRFFRKNLGAFRARMEAIFARGTTAHDVLTSKTRRAEYDAELARTAPPEPEAAPLDGSPSSRPPLDPRARRDALARRLLAGRTSRPPPPPGSSIAPGGSVAPHASVTPSAPRDDDSDADAVRRRGPRVPS